MCYTGQVGVENEGVMKEPRRILAVAALIAAGTSLVTARRTNEPRKEDEYARLKMAA